MENEIRIGIEIRPDENQRQYNDRWYGAVILSTANILCGMATGYQLAVAEDYGNRPEAELEYILAGAAAVGSITSSIAIAGVTDIPRGVASLFTSLVLVPTTYYGMQM